MKTESADLHYILRIYNANRIIEMTELAARFGEVVASDCPEGTVQVECVDVLVEPERAVRENVFVTPTLVKESPGPSLRVIGDLSDPKRVLVMLGVTSEESKA